MSSPRIAIGPDPRESVVRAVRIAGGEPAPVDADADALVWLDPGDLAGLGRALKATPAARWVQLPFAGIERVAEAGLLDTERTWTCAKGAYAEPVAEHALMLALAGLRLLRRRISARSWGENGGEAAFLYTREVAHEGSTWHARMFGAGWGILEDSATGSAVAAFAGALMQYDGLVDGEHMVVIEQGVEMGRPSFISLGMVVEGGVLRSATIGGSAVKVAQGTVDL